MSHAPRRAAHRVAVIGHGATAIETSDLLICMGDYFVDLFSKAPAPTCLIRFGSTHRASTGSGGSGRDLVPRLRLFGNIRIGAGEDAVSIGELIHYYDTVIVADDAAAAGSGLVIVGNSPLASATYEFLVPPRQHLAFRQPHSRGRYTGKGGPDRRDHHTVGGPQAAIHHVGRLAPTGPSERSCNG